MPSQRVPVIGLLVSSLFDPYQLSIWAGARAQAKALGAKLVCIAGGAPNHADPWERARTRLFDLIGPENVDAVLLLAGSVGVRVEKSVLAAFAHRLRVPAVSIGVELPGIPSLTVDNAGGMRKLVDHFIEIHHCRRIGFVKGPEENDEARARFRAYAQSLEAHGLELDPNLVVLGDFHEETTLVAVRKLLDAHRHDLDALIAADDCMALFALRALGERGIRVPEDIRLAGFDDVEQSEHSNPPLTTVSQPLRELGAAGLRHVFSLVHGEDGPPPPEVPTQLVLRSSCGCTEGQLLQSMLDSQPPPASGTGTAPEDLSVNDPEFKALLQGHAIIVDDRMNALLKQQLETLGREIRRSLEQKNPDAASRSLERIARAWCSMDLPRTLWAQVTAFAVARFASLERPPEEQLLLQVLWHRFLVVLYKVEAQHQSRKQHERLESDERLHRIGDQLMTSFNLERVSLLLRERAADLKLSACYVVTYGPNLEHAECVFAHPEPYGFIPRTPIDPRRLGPVAVSEHAEGSWFLMPLISDDTQFGHALMSLTHSDGKRTEFLASKLASSLRGAQLVDATRQHNAALERMVAERTNELVLANEQLKEQSFRDQLSGLLNRRFLSEVILPEAEKLLDQQRSVAHDRRQAGGEGRMGVLLVDLDHFKHVNDTYGHLAGDLVIKQLSEIFLSSVRSTDFVVRFGGEEFLIVLKDTSPEGLVLKMEQIRERIAAHAFDLSGGRRIKRTCSVGCLSFPLVPQGEARRGERHLVDFDTCLTLVDKALYAAKEQGRNRGLVLELNLEGLDIAPSPQSLIDAFEAHLAAGVIVLRSGTERVSERDAVNGD